MDTIQRVMYINLDERVDRKLQIQRELLQIFPATKIERFAAIKNASAGGVGCTQSHIAVLELAKKNGWSNVLIVEDDFVWANTTTGLPILAELCKQSYDVILLSGSYVDCDPSTYRLSSAQTTTAYLVSAEYYDTLLTNYKEGLAQLQKTGIYHKYALDQYWKRLQPVGRWFCVRPLLGLQRPGFSDIEGRVVDYSRYFGFVR